jgi:FixJ family two-component response regulator
MGPEAETYRILVVDDEPSVLTAYARTLKLCEKWDAHRGQSLNLDVQLFGGGAEAIDAIDHVATEGAYAICFLDMRMPEVSGLELAEHLHARNPDCHLVLVTGHSDVDLAEISRKIGRPDKLLYLQKPFHPMEICQITAALCAKWSAERSLAGAKEQLEAVVEQRTAELAEANRKLRQKVELQDLQERQLEEKLSELERFNRLTVGRELRMIELKREVNELARKAGIDPPYELMEEMAPGEMAGMLEARLRGATDG